MIGPPADTVRGKVRIQSISRVLLTLAALGSFFAASCGGSTSYPSPTAPAISPAQPAAGSPAISEVTPSASPVGTAVTVTGSGFASEGNTVKFGSGYIRNV